MATISERIRAQRRGEEIPMSISDRVRAQRQEEWTDEERRYFAEQEQRNAELYENSLKRERAYQAFRQSRDTLEKTEGIPVAGINAVMIANTVPDQTTPEYNPISIEDQKDAYTKQRNLWDNAKKGIFMAATANNPAKQQEMLEKVDADITEQKAKEFDEALADYQKQQAYYQKAEEELNKLSAENRKLLEDYTNQNKLASQLERTFRFDPQNASIMTQPAEYRTKGQEYKEQFLANTGMNEEQFARLEQYQREKRNREDREAQQGNIKAGINSDSKAERFLTRVGVDLAQIGTYPMASAEAALETLNRRNYADQEAPIDTNSENYYLSNFNRDANKVVSDYYRENGGVVDKTIGKAKGKDLGEVDAFLYGAGISTAKSLTAAAFGGEVVGALGLTGSAATTVGNIITLPMFGTDAYVTTVQDAQDRGLSTEKAIELGLTAGVAEMATEVLSLDHFWDITKGASKGAARSITRNAIVNLLTQAGIEGSEEFASDVINRAADAIISGDRSEYFQNKVEYMNHGHSEEEASKLASRDWWKQAGLDALAGTISGGLSGGAGTVASVLNNSQNAKDVYGEKGSIRETAEGIDTESYDNEADKKLARDTKAYAEQLAAKEENGGKVTNKEKRKLWNRVNEVMDAARSADPEVVKVQATDNVNTILAEENQKLDMPDVAQAEGNTQEEKVVNADLDQIEEEIFNNIETPDEFKAKTNNLTFEQAYEQIASATTPEELASAISDAKNSQNIDPKLMREIDFTANIVKNNLNLTDEDLDVQTPEKAFRAGTRDDSEFTPNTEAEQRAYVQGKIARVQAVNREKDPKTATAKDNSGNTFTVKNIENVNGETMVTTNNGQTMPLSDLTFNSAQSQKVFNNAAKSVNPQAYIDDYNPGYNVDFYNDDINAIYNYGRLHGENGSFADALKDTHYGSRLKNAQTFYDAGVSEYEGEKETKKTVQNTRKAEGKVEDKSGKLSKNSKKVLEALSKKAGVDIVAVSDEGLQTKDGKTINGFFDAKDNKITLNADGKDVYKTLIHEAMGELSEEYAPKEMDELQLAIIDWHLSKHPKAFNDTVARYQQAYQNHEGSKSYREAANEYVNDCLVELFSDEQGVKDFAEFISDKPKSIFDKFIELIDSIINGIKDLMGISEHNMFADDLKAMQDLRKMALDTWNKAIENKASVETTDQKAAASVDVKNSLLVSLDEIDNFVNDVMANKGRTNEKYNQKRVGKFSKSVINAVSKATGGKIDLSGKVLALEGGKLYHEISRHSDALAESKNGQKAYNKDNVIDIVETVLYPDIVEDASSSTSKDQRPAVVFAKEKDGGFVVVSAIGGNRNPAVTPEQVLWFDEKKWDKFKNSGKALVEYIYQGGSTRTFNQDEIDEIKKNRVTVVRRGLKNPFALTSKTIPRSPLKTSISPSAQNTTPTGRNSIEVDSEGRDLSPKQISFFEDSKVRDNDGNLMVMYHGTPYGGFTIFRNGLNYFTPKKDYAGRYVNPSASSTGKAGANNPSVYEVYLNITKPFDVDDPETRKIFINDYVKGGYALGINPMSSDAEIEKYIENGIDWNEADNLYDFIQENDLDYDGLVLNEGGDLTENGTVYRGKSYVTFNANQIKNIDNENPTDDPDIRFSLAVPVEQSEDLIAVHNLSEDQLLESIKLGGFPMPSVAITKAEMGHDKYGDISVLFYKDTIDPMKSKKNRIYGGDAWTPTFPRIEVKVNNKVAENIRKHINDLVSMEAQRNIGFAGLDNDNLEDQLNRSRGDISNSYKNNRTLKYAFLKENGVNLDIPKVDARLNSHFTNEQILAATKVVKDLKQAESLRLYTRSFENNPQLVEDLRNAINDQFRSKYVNTLKDTKLFGKDLYEELSYSDYDNLTDGLYKYYKNGIQKEMDSNAAKVLIDEAVESREEEYDKWLKNLFNGVIEKKGLRNNKDYFTYSGNRRSWETLHDEYNLDNIVRIMSQQDEKGEAGFFSQSKIQALATKNFKNISEVRKNKGMLRMETEEEHDARVEDQATRFTKICSEIMDPNEPNQFSAFGRASDAIAEAVKRYKTVQGIDKELRQWRGLQIKDDTAQKIVDLMKDISNNPTGYFEAKPQRAVGLDEIARAVVPDNSEQELFTAMDEANIPYDTYKAGDQEDRKRVVNEVPDVRFSLDVDSDGNELSEGQKEYFANSKAVDSEGRLKVMYHGSDAGGFTVFNPKKSDDEISLFFTDNPKVADSYVSRHGVEKPGTEVILNTGKEKITDSETAKEFLESVGYTNVDFYEDEAFGRTYRKWSFNSPFYATRTYGVSEKELIAEANSMRKGRKGLYKVYLNLENPLVIDAKEQYWNRIEYGKQDSFKIDVTKDGEYVFLNKEAADNLNEKYDIDGLRKLVKDAKKNGQAKYKGETYDISEAEDKLESAMYQYDKEYKEYFYSHSKPITFADFFENSDKYSWYDLYSVQNAFDDNGPGLEEIKDYSDYDYDYAVSQLREAMEDNISEDPSYLYKMTAYVLPVEDEEYNNSLFGSTRKISKEAKEKGYDGVIIRNVYDTMNAREILSDVMIAFNSNQIKLTTNEHPTDSQDIRYSIDVVDDIEKRTKRYELDQDLLDSMDEKSYDKITDDTMSQILNSVNNVFKGQTVNKAQIQNVAKEIKDYAHSTINTENLVNELENLFNYMQNSEIDSREAFNMFKTVARDIVSQGELEDTNPGFRKYIKGIRIKLTDNQKSVIEKAFGSYNDFRKDNFGTLTLSNDGHTLDSMWSEIVRESGNQLDLNEHEETQPTALLDYIHSLKQPKNNFGANEDELATDLAIRMLEKYYAAEQQAVVDKVTKEALTKPDAEVKRLLDNARKQMRSTEQEFKKAVKGEFNERETNLLAELHNLRGDLTNLDKKYARMMAQSKAPLTKYIEQQTKADERRKIEQVGNRLIKMVYEPTKQYHMPEELRKPVGEFLSGIDFISHRIKNEDSKAALSWQYKMNRLRDVLTKLRENEDEAVGYLIDKDLLAEMEEFVDNNEGVAKVSTLKADELHKLYDIMSKLSAFINHTNKAFANSQFQTVREVAQATMREVDDFRKNRKAGNVVQEKLYDFFNISCLDPVSYFKELGPASDSIYQGLRSGEDTRTRHLYQANQYMDKIREEYGVDGKKSKQWRRDIHTFHLSKGDISLSTAQIMYMYEALKRPEARMHIEKGGIKPTTNNLIKKFVYKVRPQNLMLSEIQEIVDTLTEDQKAFADAMQKFLANECADWGNHTSMELYGYKKFTDPNYIPMKTYNNSVITDEKSGNATPFYGIINAGFTKSLVKNANNPLEIGDIFEVFSNHVVEMATYDGMAAPIMDAMRWFNYKETETFMEEGLDKNRSVSVKESIEEAMGSGGKSYFTNLIQDLNGMTPKGYDTGFINWLTGAYKKAAVMANLRVVAQQPMAYVRANNVISPKYLTEALKDMPMAAKWSEKAKKNSMLALWKSWGFYDSFIGKSMDDIVSGEESISDKVSDIAGFGAQIADDLTWGMIYRATELEILDTTDLEYDSTDFTKAVVKRFEDICDQTQVVDSVLHRTQIMRSSDGAVKAGTAFLAEPMKTYNMLHRAIAKYYNTGDKKYLKDVARAFMTFILTALATSAASSIIDALRDDDDETSFADRYAIAFIKGSADNLNPIKLFPYGSALASILEGYDNSNMAYEGISAIYDAGINTMKYLAGNGTKTWYGVVRKDVQALSKLTGIPAYNLLREVETVHNAFGENWKTSESNYKYDDVYEDVYMAVKNGGDPLKTYQKSLAKKYLGENDYSDMVKAIRKNDNQKIVDAVNDLKEAGKEEKDIKGKITSNFKKKYVATTDMTEKANMKNTLIKAFVAAGDTREQAIKKIDKWE